MAAKTKKQTSASKKTSKDAAKKARDLRMKVRTAVRSGAGAEGR